MKKHDVPDDKGEMMREKSKGRGFHKRKKKGRKHKGRG
jgi:hypothetical protein